mgnify:CR=1 FL=1
MGNMLIKQGRTSGPGSVSIIRSNISKDGISGKALETQKEALKCSPESDGLTTFVQNKVWSSEINGYKFPPFVDCEYVD